MRYFGNVGYRVTSETRAGVWTPTIIERPYYGDVLRNMRRLGSEGKVNSNIEFDNQISIVSDPFSLEHFQDIIYVTWLGGRFLVSKVDVEYPRLILTLGGVYNGDGPDDTGTED